VGYDEVVLTDALRLLAIFAIAFAINLPPAFMPATWMLLAFARIQFGLPIVPLVIGGVFFSGLGRIVLAKGSGYLGRRVMKSEAELDEVKGYLDERRNYVGLATFTYCLLPLPTNNLFVAAGIINVSLLRVMIGFWAGRSIANAFYVWTSDRVFHSLANVFEQYYSDWTAIVLQAVSLIPAALLFLLPWPRWVFRWIRRTGRRGKPEVPR